MLRLFTLCNENGFENRDSDDDNIGIQLPRSYNAQF